MPQHRSYSFGEYTLDLGRGALLKAGADVRLRPKSFNVLRLLIEKHGQLVTKEELLTAVWGQVVVTEGSLTQCLMDVRRAIGDEGQRIIRTVPRRGFIFDVPVVESDGPAQAGVQAAHAPALPEKHDGRRSWRGAAVLAVVTALAFVTWRGVALRGVDGEAPTRASTAQAPHNSIAVLPFVDLSPNKDQGYVADGIAEEILNRLAQSGDLRVISRTSSFAFRDRSVDVPGIARQLDVSHVLEGSVRRSGNHVRITAQLIAASSNSHIWSRTYDRELGDLFAVQDEIAASVATALDVTLAGGAAAERPPVSPEAYASFLQGKFFYERRAPGDMERAIGRYKEAVALDPGYARAWAALSGAYSFMAERGNASAAEWRELQGEAARKAVELDPGLAVAQLRLAQYYGETSDFTRADEHTRKAVALDPDDPLVIGSRVSDAISQGDLEEATELLRRVVVRDPLSPVSRENLGVLLLACGRLDEAMAELRRVLELNPAAGPEVRADIVSILVLQGRDDEARSVVEQLADARFRDFGLALLLHTPEQRVEADGALKRLAAGPGDVMDSVRLAEVYAFRGMRDDAFAALKARRDTLERNEATAPAGIMYLQEEMRVSPFLASLHADPRWDSLLAAPGT